MPLPERTVIPAAGVIRQMLGYHFSQWSGLPLPVLICVACSAVLRFLVLSRQACRLGVCFLHVGNGAEPQAGPGLTPLPVALLVRRSRAASLGRLQGLAATGHPRVLEVGSAACLAAAHSWEVLWVLALWVPSRTQTSAREASCAEGPAPPFVVSMEQEGIGTDEAAQGFPGPTQGEG